MRKIVFVDRFYPSSKTCHKCGYVNKGLKLSDRQWICPQCGEVIERDYNAALNILDEGLRIMETTIDKNVGCCTPEFTLADYPPMDDRLSDEVLKQLLTEKGFPIARRTIAKYREQMGIPIARLRK